MKLDEDKWLRFLMANEWKGHEGVGPKSTGGGLVFSRTAREGVCWNRASTGQ